MSNNNRGHHKDAHVRGGHGRTLQDKMSKNLKHRLDRLVDDRYEYLSNVVIRFGKRCRGYTLSQAPIDYLQWLVREDFADVVFLMDVEEYLKHPKTGERIKYEANVKATDCAPIRRGWRR
jgi:hypothetical protein